jgi:hypothetical protein
MLVPIALRGLLLLSAGLISSGEARAADPAVLAAARAEGTLAIATSAPGENFQKFMTAFGAKYPFLKLASGYYAAPTGRVLARVNAETLLDTQLYGMYSMRADVPPPAGQKVLAEAHPLLPSDPDDYPQASAAFPHHFKELFH